MKRGGPVSQDGNRAAPQRMRGPIAGGRATAEPAEAGCRTGPAAGTDSAGTMPAVFGARLPGWLPAGGDPFSFPLTPNNSCGAKRLPFSRRKPNPPQCCLGGEAEHRRAGCPAELCPDGPARGQRYGNPHDAVLRGGRVCWSGVGSSWARPATSPPPSRRAGRGPPGIAPQGRL